ncbi:uncharacterized protein LOC110442068 [Mizuhopecten yessoensis]|uniref:uncharacterized protein LOC110442068 n=1 Tax=Mizuhopecten yessoensis TaxID=6573 RepID=UPI000B45D5EC|nr:uncharacterized protein LOC110442068 [Mizuhopecten yessoensis]
MSNGTELVNMPQSEIPGQVAPVVAQKEMEPALITLEQSSHTDESPTGRENKAFQEEAVTSPEETRPMLTYMDFMPNYIAQATSPDEAPTYARFSFIVDQANAWLNANQDFTVWKCESISYKLVEEDQYDTKGVLHSESSYGVNRFVMGLRLWLVPRISDTMPVAQIGYTTAIPGEPYTDEDQGTAVQWEKTQAISSGGGNFAHDMLTTVVSSLIPPGTNKGNDKDEKAGEQSTTVTDITNKEGSQPVPERRDIAAHLSEPTHRVSAAYYTTMTSTIKGLNKKLTRKPLPGVILNVENLTLRASTEQSRPQIVMDPECTSWAEVGRRNTVYVFAIRIFYLKGREEFCTIGFHDELPDMMRAGPSIKFGPFSNVVDRMGYWLKHQKNIRVVNMQSVNMQCNLDQSNVYQVKSDVSGFMETAHLSTRYAKVLRLFYVTTASKSDLPPYTAVKLNTRLFAPVRRGEKTFESFPKTMERVIKWLDYLRIPPFFVETVSYQIYTHGVGKAVLPDRVDSSVNRNSGRHILNTIRLYMPSDFIEPPPELAPDVATVDQGWGCTIS